MKTVFASLLPVLLALGGSLSVQAQELLTTLGTTVTVNGQAHAYLLWQPQATEDSLFRRFAVYSKAGTPDSSAVFVRDGIQSLQSSPRTLRALLELGSQIDRDALGAARRIDALFRDLTLRSSQAPVAANLDAADKLAFIIQSSATDPKLLGRLFFLGRAHAGVMLALGHAFTKPMPAGVRTYEVREINDSDTDLRVLGRVTLDPALPLVLPAPGAPVVVPHALEAGSAFTVSPKDHLNARLRWGVDDPLRARLAHTFGFDLFRVRKSTAEGLGWHLTPPVVADLLTLLAAVNSAAPNPDISSANELPVLVPRPLTIAQAANVTEDKDTLYFADDSIRHDGPGGARIQRPFTDGEAYYYFAAARDIAGRPGQLSRGTLVTYCDRLPPAAPVIDSVTNVFVPPADAQLLLQQGGSQFLKVSFNALPANQQEGADKYFIYRWETPQQFLEHLGDDPENAPNLHVIGSVPNQAGRSVLTFDDKGPGAPTLATHQDRSVWYTVRAKGRTACGDVPTFSGHSAPMPGVLRDFVAPDAPDGTLFVTHNTPRATFVRSVLLSGEIGVDPIISQTRPSAEFVGVSVRLSRLNPEITAATVTVGFEEDVSGTKRFTPMTTQHVLFQQTDLAEVHVPELMPRPPTKNALKVVVKAVTASGLVSPPAQVLLPGEGSFSEYAVTLFDLSTVRDTGVEPGAGRTTHEVANADGSINVIRGVLVYDDEDIREWRVYRRIQPDGQLTLIAKGEGDPKGSNTANTIPDGDWQDDAPPGVPGTEVCYYGQILDQNANPSPLFLIGCVTIASPVLPVPMLSPAVSAAGGNGRPEVNLEWFCDPVGVDRFEVLIAREGGGVPAISGLTQVPVERAGGPVETFVTHERFPGLAFHVFQTSAVGETVPGAGPRFTARLSLNADGQVLHYFAVRAVGPGPFPRSTGALSNVVTSDFVPPPAVDAGFIPWPARPLPPVDANDLLESAFSEGEGRFLAFTKLTDLPFEIYRRLKAPDNENLLAPTFILVGVLRMPLLARLNGSETSVGRLDYDGAAKFFKFRANRSDPASLAGLGNFLVFRYQLPSTAFPDARPNLVQCTPLIHTISSVRVDDVTIKVRDPFISIFPIPNQPGSNVDPPVDFIISPFNNQTAVVTPGHLVGATGLVCVKDPLPVIQGAKYQHLLVSLGADDEIRRVIKLNPVQH